MLCVSCFWIKSFFSFCLPKASRSFLNFSKGFPDFSRNFPDFDYFCVVARLDSTARRQYFYCLLYIINILGNIKIILSVDEELPILYKEPSNIFERKQNIHVCLHVLGEEDVNLTGINEQGVLINREIYKAYYIINFLWTVFTEISASALFKFLSF